VSTTDKQVIVAVKYSNGDYGIAAAPDTLLFDSKQG